MYKPAPKPKHPLKVHVWGGISKHGPTELVIFEGIMDVVVYCQILETSPSFHQKHAPCAQIPAGQ